MEKYRTVKTIGTGAYGKAILVEQRTSREKYVIKVVDMRKMPAKEKVEARKECDLLREMSHPNIISFIESFEAGTKLNIVMDYADGGDLSGLLEGRRGRLFPEQQIIDYFVQICLAMKHVHDRKILHRDLKAQNIFLTSKGMVKLGDFGIAKVLRNTRELARTQIGTPYYLSPEICNGKAYNNKSDVWSLGVVLYELATLKHPFNGRNIQQLVVQITRGRYTPISTRFSRPFQLLLKSLLNANQSMRPSVNKILKQPIMQKRISAFLGETLLNDEFSHTVLHGDYKKNAAAARNASKDPNRLGAPDARAAPVASEPTVVAPASGPKPSTDPKAQSRGICPGCGASVMTDQDRTKDDAGSYWHVECVRKNKAKATEPKKPAAAVAPAPARAPSPIEPSQKDVSDYASQNQARHADFIARRAARQANKKRHENERWGRKPAPWAVGAPESEVQSAGGGGRDKPRISSSGDDAATKAENARAEAVREYNERQRAAKAYRARDPRKGGGHSAPTPAAEPEPVAVAPVESTTPAKAKASAADDAAALKAAATKEYNERQRQAREFRKRAELDENPAPDPAPAEPAPEQVRPTPAVVAVKPAAAKPKVTKPKTTKPKAQASTRAHTADDGPTIDLGKTTVIRKGKTDPDNLPSADGSKPSTKKSERAAKQQQKRDELRAMIMKQRSDMKNKIAKPAPLPPIGATDANASSNEGRNENLGSTIARFLNAQVSEIAEVVAEEATPEPAAETEAPAPAADDCSEAGAAPASEAASPEDVTAAKEDHAYQDYLLQLSMVSNGVIVEESEGGEESGDNWLNGGEGSDSEFGDDDEDEAKGEESIFARMERLKAELEEEVGPDQFVQVYKLLRDAFGGDDDGGGGGGGDADNETAVTQVPAETSAEVMKILGADKEDLFENMVGLVKSELGVFE